MPKNIIVKLILLICFTSFIHAQSEREIDSLLNTMNNSDDTRLVENSNKVTDLFYLTNRVQGKKICNLILKYLSKSNNKALYIRIYLNSEMFYPFKEKIKIFNKAYEMARKEGYENLMGFADMMKSFAYRDNAITDSAMICALRAKSIFEKTGNNNDLVFVLLVISDLHYYAGQLEKAEDLYNDILIIEGEPKVSGNWVYSTVLNDLGLIRIKQNRLRDAEKYFTKALNYVNLNGWDYADSLRLSYIYRKLMEVYILQNKLDKADYYYKQGLIFAEKFDQKSELISLFINHAKYLFIKRDFSSALKYYKQAEKLEKDYPDIKSKVSIYEGLTKTYGAVSDLKNSYNYISLLRKVENQRDSLYYRAKYMNIYAEHNYEKYLEKIADYKLKQIILSSFITLIILSLVIIIYYYIKLRNANIKMVKKNLELALSSENTTIPIQTVEQKISEYNVKTEDYHVNEDTICQIQSELETIMTNEKLYLNSEVSLDEVANRLKTNRAYLSKTINAKYRMNFNTYINTLRIKEAVKFISFGEHKILTLEGIAQKVGFNNRVSFNKAFIRYSGVTPSFFIKNAEN